MNERIKELIKKATTVEEHKWGVSYDNFDKERFAFLIIQEAGEAFWSDACNVSDLAYEEYYRNSKKVKQHFGIE